MNTLFKRLGCGLAVLGLGALCRSDKGSVRAHHVVATGNKTVHEGDFAFSEEDASRQRALTTLRIRVVVHRGGVHGVSALE